MNSRDTTQGEVEGERGAATVERPHSIQSRISSILAVGLMSVLGLGALTWYYANAVMGPGRSRRAVQAAVADRAQGESALPSLGRIALPPQTLVETPVQQEPLSPTSLTEIPLTPSAANPGYGGPPPAKTAEQLARERMLSGVAFAARPPLVTATEGATDPFGRAASETGAQGPGELTMLLRPRITAAVNAQMLPTQRLLLPKGAFIDCTLETAIDSTLPGMTTCIMATDTFGVDGKVVLLERGTKLTGETRGQVQQGAARIFVLWTEARTPKGVIVPLASPGADELGRSGLAGTVNRHFWERFGAAMLVSVIDGAVQAAVQSSRGGGTAIAINPSSSQDVLTEVLKNTINIAPTVLKRNGDRIQVLVARDLDFRSVYELRSTPDR